MSDEELLDRYESYKKKRNIIIIIIALLFIISLIIVINFPKGNEPMTPNVEQPKEEMEIDNEKPVLELTVDNIDIEINQELDYKAYIKVAKDNVDGDLKDKVMFNKIDVSKVGLFEVVYYVFDSSNNMTQAILTINIKEPPKQEEIQESNTIANQPEENNSVNQTENSSSLNEKSEQENTNKEPAVKYFMFEDGYNMGNVVEACASELKKSGRSGRCLPITDDNGIYLGMKLELN